MHTDIFSSMRTFATFYRKARVNFRKKIQIYPLTIICTTWIKRKDRIAINIYKDYNFVLLTLHNAGSNTNNK